MNLLDAAVVFLGGYVVLIILAALVISLWPGRGEAASTLPDEELGSLAVIPLRQRSGVMPRKAWGFRPPVHHSHYDPAPWQVRPPASEEDSLENVDRATDIKRELGSEHPPWERLDRQGL